VKLTRRGEYALRAMLELSERDEGDLVRSQEVAARQDIPPKFLPQIINSLARAGMIETVRGAAGGVRLARSSGEITLRDVIEAIEGPITLNHCCHEMKTCERERRGCPLSPVWQQAQSALTDVLQATTLAQIARRDLEQ
jgi:Rrf2 family transcriptional regulator, iron-sulfur cluster assembly transcription factor